ncbi:MAG: hypothetical protein ACLFVE_11340 [Chitinispirillaceae bacterium]
MKANCEMCGKEYEKRGSAKTCGEECRKHRRRALDRERSFLEGVLSGRISTDTINAQLKEAGIEP